MVDHFFKDRAAAQRLRATLLGPHLDSFTACVTRLGYARSSIRLRLWLLAELGRWLTRRAISVSDLRASVTEDFLRRRRVRRLRRGDAATLRRFLGHLQTKGVIPTPPPVVDRSALGRLKVRRSAGLIAETTVDTRVPQRVVKTIVIAHVVAILVVFALALRMAWQSSALP